MSVKIAKKVTSAHVEKSISRRNPFGLRENPLSIALQEAINEYRGGFEEEPYEFWKLRGANVSYDEDGRMALVVQDGSYVRGNTYRTLAYFTPRAIELYHEWVAQKGRLGRFAAQRTGWTQPGVEGPSLPSCVIVVQDADKFLETSWDAGTIDIVSVKDYENEQLLAEKREELRECWRNIRRLKKEIRKIS